MSERTVNPDSATKPIIVHGYKVYPEEVEAVLHKHESIAEAAVVGTPDDHLGQAVHAAVRLKPGRKASQEEIIKYCQTKLDPYKVPRTIKFVEDFPRSEKGDILKREIQIEWGNVYGNDLFVQHP